ncbi:MAG: hypothetical protein M1820_000839 [Bogoriella megaspora]|nr:MAG: hypothetical protein M1820_000839 [Bogoriella megaspora]
MADQPLLNQLCKCSGKRDHSAFVSKAQLSTSAGIDHDYNFLSGIERAVDQSERTVEEKGIKLRANVIPSPRKTGKRKRTGEHPNAKPPSKLELRLRESDIVIKRAPTGMSRQKRNKTTWDPKGGCIGWTVEWIDSNNNKAFKRVYALDTIEDSYSLALKGPQSRRGKKKLHKEEASRAITGELPAPSFGATPDEAIDTRDTGSLASAHQHPSQIENKGALPNLSSEQTLTTSAQDNNTPHPSMHFYLHKPHTRCPEPVLIPLKPSDTLSTCLKHRVILEFPTIYALPYSPDQLPAAYRSETTYLRRSGRAAQGRDEADTRQINIEAGAGDNPVVTSGDDESETGSESSDFSSSSSDEGEDDEQSESSEDEDNLPLSRTAVLSDGTMVDQRKLIQTLQQDLARASKA